MSRNKLIVKPFKNKIGQTINPGDPVLLVRTSKRVITGFFAGVVGKGASIVHVVEKDTAFINETDKIANAVNKRAAGCPQPPTVERWKDFGLWKAYYTDYANWMRQNCHMRPMKVVRRKYSPQKMIFKHVP